jgi:hypothetical protein
VAFWQNWYVGSQSAFDAHAPNGGASVVAPPSTGVAAAPAEQLESSTWGLVQVCVGGGKFAALHVVTAEPPPPHV